MVLIKATREELLKPIQAVTGIIDRNPANPILSNILIENINGVIKFLGTDLDMQIISNGPNSDSNSFKIITNAKKIQDILTAIPNDSLLSLELENNQLIIKFKKGKYILQTISEEFPKMSVASDIISCFSISSAKLSEMLYQVQYAIALVDVRAYFKGLLIKVENDQLILVATDGHRLTYSTTKIDVKLDNYEVVVPRKAVGELIKILHKNDFVNIEFLENKQIAFRSNDTIMISKIIDHKFPDYNKAIPLDNDIIINLDREEFLFVLDRVSSILLNDQEKSVRLLIQPGLLRVVCKNKEEETAQEDIEIAYQGKTIEVSYNLLYLTQMLRNIHNEEIQLSLSENTRPSLFTIPNNLDFKYVVMPMRV